MPRIPANHAHPLRTLSVILIAVVGLAVFAGCGGDDDPEAGAPSAPTQTAPPAGSTAEVTTTASTTTAPVATRTVTVYFADAEGQKLVAESRPSSATGSPLRAALVSLADGPGFGGGQPALPPGTQIIGTDVQAGTALVNLSDEFVSGYPSGGAAAEFAVLAPLVYTATAVDGVEKVRITVQGQVPAPPGSQFDWGGTFSRADFPDVVAP